MEPKKYYLGLDVGTDSVGFCVTDQDYHIIKKHRVVRDGENTKYYGNHIWGARLFDEASTAKGRRSFREGRRRYQRRRWRITLLQDIFKDEMAKVDPYFFDRLNNSAIHNEDREEQLRSEHLLFNETSKSDNQFFEDYPTIYHLRKAILKNPEMKFDIREIYLCLAHMIKYRGNFLHEGEMNSIGNDPKTIMDEFNQLDEILEEINLQEESTDSISFRCTPEIAEDLNTKFKTITKIGEISDAMVAAFKLTGSKSTSLIRQMLDLIAGKKKKLSGLFPEIELDEETGKTAIEFDSDDFLDKVIPICPDSIGEERTKLLLKLKEIYDIRILSSLLRGESSVSKAMVQIYENHKRQLKELKVLVRRYNPKEYSNFFRKQTVGKGKDAKPIPNYVNYIGFNDVKRQKVGFKHSITQDDLYAQIKKILPVEEAAKETFIEKEPGDKERLLNIKNSIEGKTYLLRQNSKENGVLPYQLNLNEMRQILDNQKKYYPFLGEMDKDYNNPDKQCYKIESILKFKIPYFVGPLSAKAKIQWIAKNSDERITPWNFHDVVNEDQTAEKFMENLKNYCTYLIKEPTLPKQSLIYQMYVLLNEMNKWKINGQYITKEDKKYLIQEVYFKKKKPTLKSVQEALKCKYKTGVTLTSSGTTVDGERGVTADDFHATLSSWISMMDDRAFGNELCLDCKKQALAEQIIYDIATFENKDLMLKRLKKYNLTDSQIKYIANLKFDGWARLSNKLLSGLKIDTVNTDTGEILPTSIMDLMWETNQNFMEILTSKKDDGDYRYGFMPQIEKLNEEIGGTIDDVLESLYVSPMMKRALLQTMKIVEELKNFLHIDHFDSYFVESTRTEGEKKRTQSRKKKLLEYYAAVKKNYKEERVARLEEDLKNREEGELQGKKLFLYFMQLGKSVYTGKEIPIDELSTNYDIDHIIPQSKVKDDSFLNTVLVEKQVNNNKSDLYPIPNSILTKEGRDWINILSSKSGGNLMPTAKRDRLLRSVTRPLTDSELSGFVQRQLVSTSQSVKAICEVLKKIDPKAKIVYSKAGNVSDFRKIFDLVKSREANDFHHAHDAYLNIVVGNVFNKLFSSGNPKNIQHKLSYLEGMNMKPEYIFKHDARMMYTDALVWKAKRYLDKEGKIEDPDSKGTIDLVRKYLSYQDPLVTQMMYTNVGKQGFFNKISLHTAKEGNASYPLKMTGPFSKPGFEKIYGGYSDLTNPYVSLVRSDGKKGKHIYSLEFIPTIARMTIGEDEAKLEKYLSDNNGLKNPKILIEKLLMKTIVQIPYTTENGKNGYIRLGISGKSNDSIVCFNMSELHISEQYMKTIKKISKLLGLNNQAGNKVDTSVYEQFEKGDIRKGKIELTRTELHDLFMYLIDDAFCRPEYEGLPILSTTFKKLKTHIVDFETLTTFNQIVQLINLIKLISCKSVRGVNLTNINNCFPKNCGIIMISKNLTLNTKISQTSVTGLYEKVLFTVPED
mgnify:CR=1 FL=1